MAPLEILVFGTKISTGITGIINEIIDYAIFIMLIMLIYYCIKFFLVHGPPGKTKEEKEVAATEDAQRVEEFQKFVGTKLTESKKKREETREKEHRQLLVMSAKSSLIHAERAAEELRRRELRTVSKDSLTKAKKKVKEIDDHLDRMQRELKKARLKANTQAQDYLRKVGARVDIVRRVVDTNILGQFPANETDPQWAQKVTAVHTALDDPSGLPYFGALILSLDQFIESNAMNVP